MTTSEHPVIKNQELVEKVLSRRGKLHAYPHVDPVKSCIVVVDLMIASIEADPRCAELIEPLNETLRVFREAGGHVAWVTTASSSVNEVHVEVFGEETARLFHERAQPDDERSYLPQELNVHFPDIHASKEGFSAFFPGRSDLVEQLKERSVESVLICGTVTNICCESSARDAVELGFKTIILADLCRGHAHGLHDASLTTFFRTFGDVRLSSELSSICAVGV